MPFRHLPNSADQRVAAMHGANTKWIATTNPPDRLITPEHFASLDLTDPDSLYSVYKRDVGEAGGALAHQADLTSDHDAAVGALAQSVSHFIQVLNFAISRRKLQPSDRAYYGLDVSQTDVPLLNSHVEIDQWAHKLIDGETDRLAANPGATPMAMPSVADIAADLALVESTRQTQTTAKDAFDKEQGDIDTSNPAVDTFIRDMWDTIEFNLRAETGPSRRRRGREWGIVYLTRPGEAPDPEPPGPTEPPPTT